MELAVVLTVNFLLGCLAGGVAGLYVRNKALAEKEDREFEERYLQHMHG